jgi:hypothetical protein
MCGTGFTRLWEKKLVTRSKHWVRLHKNKKGQNCLNVTALDKCLKEDMKPKNKNRLNFEPLFFNKYYGERDKDYM